MSKVAFLFHGRLNDFLQWVHKNQRIVLQFRRQQSIKHLVESLGVPHPELGIIQVNGQNDSWARIAQDADEVEVFPIDDGFLNEPLFLLDCHLGRLTAYLRMLGFDCLYQNNYDDLTMAKVIQEDERILLTRDRRLLMRKVIQHGYCLRSLNPMNQLMEVISRFELMNRSQSFHRCLRCNHPLLPVEKGMILDRLKPLTKQYFDEFHICPGCNQIYWKGSHFTRMRSLIEQTRNITGTV